MKSIYFNSLLIGILGTTLVMVLMGQSSIQKQYDVECVYYPENKLGKKQLCVDNLDYELLSINLYGFKYL